MLEPYDENNGFNIFTNNLKLRKKQQNAMNQPKAEPEVASKDAAPQGLTKETKDAVKGLKISIKRLHLRYEDDYYSFENPYSFGIVIDELNFDSSDMRVFFERLADFKTK